MSVLLLLFWFGFLLFLFLLWLLWLKLPKLCWIIAVRVVNLVLFLILAEMVSVFHHWQWCCCGFVIYGLYYVELSSLYAYFLESFFINGCWILSKAFSASIEIIIWFLFFSLLIWCITFIDLHILKNPCIPGINPTWSWCMMKDGSLQANHFSNTRDGGIS